MDALSIQPLPHEALNNPELALSTAAGFRTLSPQAVVPVVGAETSLGAYAATIAVAICGDATRKHLLQRLAECDAEIKATTAVKTTHIVELGGDQTKVLEWLQGYFSANSEVSLILISDMLKPPTDPKDGFLTRECQKRFSKYAMGTIAILQSLQKIIDIDRTIAPDVHRYDLVHAMVMLLERIEYLMPPVKRQPADPQSVVVRPLKNGNEVEFQSYFKLRYRVYSPMGYLKDSTESSPEKLEMDEADVHSIHIGAFCQSGCREFLVGSARVVTNEGADPSLIDLLERIAQHDSISRKSLIEPYPLGLAIFQSFDETNPIITETLKQKQKCGELSRVIVDQAFRGQGIANRLITEALKRAVGRKVMRIFLECLKIHEPLYEKHGFKRMPWFEASVIDVKRTMIAMELQPEVITKIAQRVA